MTEFYMHEYLPFQPIASCGTSDRLEGKLRRVFLHYSQPSHKFQHVNCVLGGLTWASAGIHADRLFAFLIC